MASGKKIINTTAPFARLNWFLNVIGGGGVLVSDSHKFVLTFILGLRGTFTSNFNFLSVWEGRVLAMI